MTSLVGIRCRDGVVIAADSSATFGTSFRTIEQETKRKIEIIGNTGKLIIAGTGYVGHHQRFVEAVRVAHARGDFKDKSDVDAAKQLATTGLKDFSQTLPAPQLQAIHYSALVAYQAKGGKPCLCELEGTAGFQPEVKRLDDLWFVSHGSGQPITDPFLAFFRQVFWKEGAPDVKGGIFTAYWALKHACEVNPGGIKEPINIAVLSSRNGVLDAWMLDDDQLDEHGDVVNSAMGHFAAFRDIMTGSTSENLPTLPKAP